METERPLYIVEKWGAHVYIMRGYKTGTNKDYRYKTYRGNRYWVENGISDSEFREACNNGWHVSK